MSNDDKSGESSTPRTEPTDKHLARIEWSRQRGLDGKSCPSEAMCAGFDAGFDAVSDLLAQLRHDLGLQMTIAAEETSRRIEAERDLAKAKQTYASACARVVKMGVASFGTLDAGLDKLVARPSLGAPTDDEIREAVMDYEAALYAENAGDTDEEGVAKAREKMLAIFKQCRDSTPLSPLAASDENLAKHWRGEYDGQVKEVARKQAEIDRLMIEYCPEEMMPEQIEEWKRHQVSVSPEQEVAIEQARLSSNAACVGLSPERVERIAGAYFGDPTKREWCIAAINKALREDRQEVESFAPERTIADYVERVRQDTLEAAANLTVDVPKDKPLAGAAWEAYKEGVAEYRRTIRAIKRSNMNSRP